MAYSSGRIKKLLGGLLAMALSIVMYWFGTGLQPHPWLTWLAPLPLLFIAPQLAAIWLTVAAFIVGVVASFNGWHYLHHVIGAPLQVVVPAMVAPGVVLALCVLLFRRLLSRGYMVGAILAVPALWVSLEFLNAQFSPHGTFGNIGYTQMGVLPIIQIAAITGIWGVGFVLLWVPTVVAVVMLPYAPARKRIYTGGIALLLLCLCIGLGYWRLQTRAMDTVRVGLVSFENPVRPALRDADGDALLHRYLAAIRQLAVAGARVVLIPETSLTTTDATIPAFNDIAQQYHLILGVGITSKADPKAERNMLMVFRPGFSAPATYAKRHLIPGLEDQYKAGADYTMLNGAPRIGLAICKDMDFQDVSQSYAERHAQLLLVPAWDFGVDGWLHARMAIMRGVESGFAVARAARNGMLTLSDDRGRVIAEATSQAWGAELIGTLPLRTTHTLYAQWGDWFAWLNLLLLLGLLMLSWLPPSILLVLKKKTKSKFGFMTTR